MVRRYLTHWPDEAPSIFRMLDLIADGAEGHVHLLLVAAHELGLRGRKAVGPPPSSTVVGPIQHFQIAFLKPGSPMLALKWRIGRGFGRLSFWTSQVRYNYLTLPTCKKEINCC